MAVKYFCDGCGSEVAMASQANPKPIATLEIVNPLTGKSDSLMICQKCVPKLKDYVNSQRLENKLEKMVEPKAPSILT